MLNKLYFFISKLKKGKKRATFRIILLMIPAIFFISFLALSPSEDTQDNDANIFEYEQF